MASFSGSAYAQQPRTPFDPPAPAAPTPWAPTPGAPAAPAGAPVPAAPAGAPAAPATFGPGPGAAPGALGATPPPGAWGAPVAGADGAAAWGAPPAPPGVGVEGEFGVAPNVGAAADVPAAEVDEVAERANTLAEQLGLNGSIGLLRTAYAGSGAPGTFRAGFIMDWFSASGFLCNADTPCDATGSEDDAGHVGGWFAVNATPLPFLEAYAGLRTYANSNNLGSPTLLQVLGDTTLGLKVFTPNRVAKMLTFGGDIRLLLLNGAGDVGLAGSGTGFHIDALTSLDLRKLRGVGVGAPARIHLNLGYHVDNSGNLVEDVEKLRAERNPDVVRGLARIPISRIERFGLGINRVDFVALRLGVDAPFKMAQPYLEYTIDIPVNRQGYECHTRTISPGDVCLALSDLSTPTSGAPGASAAPSRLSVGVRATPFEGNLRGLSGHLGFDIGLTGTSTFIEEVAPQAPWTLFIGGAYAFDVRERIPVPVVLEPVQLPPLPAQIILPPPQYYVRGVVKEKGAAAIANAIVQLQGATEPPFATDASGRFLTRHLEPGTHTFAITAEGFKAGTCTATIQAAIAEAPAAPVAVFTGAPAFPGAGPTGAPAFPGAGLTGAPAFPGAGLTGAPAFPGAGGLTGAPAFPGAGGLTGAPAFPGAGGLTGAPAFP
ncbi:MAG: hypothetical protein EXR75_06190, partial [Myxococcales bacterium]|nr:hypothetical protein [Myxococcales bacterium]